VDLIITREEAIAKPSMNNDRVIQQYDVVFPKTLGYQLAICFHTGIGGP
jgi:hypothetical protein